MRITRKYVLSLILAASLPAAAAELTVHISPSGNDSANGSSASDAVASLQRALKIAEGASAPDLQAIRIEVHPGIYRGQTATARGNRAGIPIVIGGAKRNGGRVSFDGDGKGGTWFTLKPRGGNPSNIKIVGVEVANYETVIDVDGGRSNPANWAGGLEIRGNRFSNIGDIAREGAPPSTAAVRLVNSDRNIIAENTFTNIKNNSRCVLLHALYVAHGSTDNLIEQNVFEDSCGDAVRFRDRSDNNMVRKNLFTDAWSRSPVSDWFCNADKRDGCTKADGECPSANITIEANKINVKGKPPADLFVGYGGKPPKSCDVKPGVQRAIIR